MNLCSYLSVVSAANRRPATQTIQIFPVGLICSVPSPQLDLRSIKCKVCEDRIIHSTLLYSSWDSKFYCRHI